MMCRISWKSCAPSLKRAQGPAKNFYLTNDKKCAIILLENESEEKTMDKKELKAYKKMSPEEVQGLMAMRRKGGAIKAKKGKGSYDRKTFKKGVA